MQVSKNFKSKKAPEDFRRSNDIRNTFVKYLNQLGMSGYSVSARIIHRGIQVTKNCIAVSSKDSWNNGERFGASCINKINLE